MLKFGILILIFFLSFQSFHPLILLKQESLQFFSKIHFLLQKLQRKLLSQFRLLLREFLILYIQLLLLCENYLHKDINLYQHPQSQNLHPQLKFFDSFKFLYLIALQYHLLIYCPQVNLLIVRNYLDPTLPILYLTLDCIIIHMSFRLYDIYQQTLSNYQLGEIFLEPS